MRSDMPLDSAVFQLSPKHSRCELVVSRNGNKDKLASGLVKPFVTHLTVAEEQFALAVNSIKLEVERHKNADAWFTKGTLERFVRFVSKPDVLEMVNTLDVEMSDLEAARKIYSLGLGDQFSGVLGSDVAAGTTGGADATKMELLRAMDVRLAAVRQDLTMAFSRASAAGFNLDTISSLQLFANHFGAQRLYEACTKFISLCQRRSDLINPHKAVVKDQVVRSSWGSDMSIDDPTEDLNGTHQPPFQYNHPPWQAGQVQQQLDTARSRHHLNQSIPSSCQQPSLSHPTKQESVRNEKREEKKKKEAGTKLPPSQPSQLTRRLSVQDRISLFENKQKESSGGVFVSVGKSAELRRLPSDASSIPAAEKAVLRRWSGASDISIDCGDDKKDSNYAESPLCTPSASSVTQTKSNIFSGLLDETKGYRQENDTTSTASSYQLKNISKSKDQSELQTRGGGFVGEDREASLIDQLESQAHQFSGRKQIGVGDSGLEEENLKTALSVEERSGVIRQPEQEGKSIYVSDRVENMKNQTVSQNRTGSSLAMVREAKFANRVEDGEASNQILSQSQFRGPQTNARTLTGQSEDGFQVEVKEVARKETVSDQSASQWSRTLFTREVEHARKESASSRKEPDEVEDLEVPIMKVQNPFSAGAEETMKPQGRRGESNSVHGNDRLGFLSKKAPESQESLGSLEAPVEQVQRVRQSKGNQELNDELKMKADELEKLFAEHKLRIPVDQSGSTWRAKYNEMQVEQTASSQNKKLMAVDISLVQLPDKKTLKRTGNAGDIPKFNNPPPMKMVDNSNYGSSLRQNFSELILLDDSRGIFFKKYMQKRDAKLREDWGTKGLEKEAKLKALQHRLAQSKAEMEAKFSGSVDRQNSSSSALWRAEKLRLFNLCSSMKGEQPVESFQIEEDDDLSELPENNHYGQDSPLADVCAQNKKILPNRNLAAFTPRTAAPVPRSSVKNSNPSSGRRRAQSENPLAQSVPNFADFRKENTKPYSVATKLAYRSQGRTYAHSKSTSEEVHLSKDEKSRESQSLRKSTTDPSEFKDFPSLNPDGVVLIPPKWGKEQREQSPYKKFSKLMEAKPFLRKGNGIGPGSGASVAKLKASIASEVLKDGKEFEVESPFEVEEVVEVEKEEEVGLQTLEAADGPNVVDAKSKLSSDSDEVGMYGSANGDPVRFDSQLDPSSAAELPASPPSTVHAMGSSQDSPGESPVSWNSRMHHPFSYPNVTLDIDAHGDSPTGSPASWNPHSQVDAARMRKKWGSAPKPILVANSSQNQSRKDVTKGFKRLLKFGRKSRGTETLVDWISATTSEGDDDTEDGRDLVNRTSEDSRKSRMGFSLSHPSDDGLHESELFNEHVQALHSSIPAPPANFKLRDDLMSGSSIKAPRSFFSLSSFRSKGSDSKP